MNTGPQKTVKLILISAAVLLITSTSFMFVRSKSARSFIVLSAPDAVNE